MEFSIIKEFIDVIQRGAGQSGVLHFLLSGEESLI
jgi:hypothetical protein